MTRSAGATTPPPVTEGELRDIVGEVMVGEVMRSFAGAPPRASTAAAAHGPTVSAYVSITGAWAGTVVVTFSEALARAATADMLRRPQGTLSTDDVSDAVGELANMIGGNVKARMPEPSALSLPVVARRRPWPWLP
jgi:chemotaxis protein CheX